MLDVHPPEHRIGGTKDFFLHLFTITCGLLIALGLENAVEAIHHHHERVEAEESVRHELAQNRMDARAAAAGLKLEIQNIERPLHTFKPGAKAGLRMQEASICPSTKGR